MKFVKLLFILLLSTSLLLGLVHYEVRRDQTRHSQPVPQHVCDRSDDHLCFLEGTDVDGNVRIPSILRQRPEDSIQQPSAAPARFTVIYNGFSAREQRAFQHAADIWSAYVESPASIRIRASFRNTTGSGLGSASIRWKWVSSPNLWAPEALANALVGTDSAPSNTEIYLTFFRKAGRTWYFGTDGNTPSGRYDFVSVVLHEIGHGLGFIGFARVARNTGAIKYDDDNPSVPSIYDSFIVNGSGTALTTFDDPSIALRNEIISNNLFWDGTIAKAANDGNRPKLYAPTTWSSGSSLSHLDGDTYPLGNSNSLMRQRFGTAVSIHTPGPIILGMLEDMGWTLNKPPVFTSTTTTFSVAENTPANQNIGTPLTATDEDTDDTLTYSLRDASETPFTIDSSTGQLKTSAPPNYETQNSYTLTAVVDDGGLEGTLEITINLTDVDDAPMFTDGSTTRAIVEGTTADRNIGAPVSAIEEDAGDSLTYTLSGTDAASFSIDSTNGQLKTKAALNHGTKNTYSVIVTATDTTDLTDTISVTINVIGPVVFTDTALASAVRSALGIRSNDAIYPAPLEALRSLTATDDAITDLTGLEKATGLTTLDLSDNTIVNISPLANLTNLQTLDLSDNAISNVSTLSNLTALKRLDLRDNDVRNVTPLSTMTHLTHLYLNGNDNLTHIKQLLRLTSTTVDIDLPEAVEIPNVNLKTAVRNALSLPADDIIVREEMQGLTSLTATGNSIDNLTGLETATALTHAILSNNDIVNLSPLSGLGNLETLELSNNDIVNLNPLSGLNSLQDLNLAHNDIVRLQSLSALSSLTELDLSNNAITDVSPLANLTNLTELDLSNNAITDVSPLANLTSLTELDLTDNTGITNPDTLYKLKQNGTTIIGIDVSEAVIFADTNLEAAVKQTLRIAATEAVSFDAIETLTQLTATRKQITSLEGLETATTLERLDVGNNEITDVSPLEDLTSLETLDLADNKIEDVSLLQNLTNLTDLDLDGNQIQNVSTLPSLTSLQTLELTDNDVGNVTPLSTMTHLTHLYLRGNENLSNIKQLVKLKNAGTRIDITLPGPVNITDDNLEDALQTALGFQTDDPIFPEDMATLTTLSAPNRSITTLTGLEKAINLITLNLSNNKISSISPLSRLTKLESIDLSENTISSISSLSGLTALTELDLSNNRISSVSSLLRLIALTSLDLSENTISSLSTLSKLTALTALDLADNRITDVLALQGLSSLSTLDLSGNTGLTTEKAAVLYKLEQVGTTIILPPGVTLPTQANIVVFNNPALETAVRSRLRIRTGYPILTDDITDLTTLTATSKKIDDLTGLADATGLTRLDLGNNEIVSLTPISGLTSLTNLDLADNQIQNLSPLQNLTNLTNLDLDDNQITNVSGLSNLTNLTNLDLRGNDVGDVVHLQNLTSLRYIYLRGNENLTNLEWLGAIENLRADISLPDVVRLPDSNLDTAVRNALRDDGNTVSNDLPMSEELLESLETLTASNSAVADLTGSEYMTGLTLLDLQNNQINDVSPLSRLYSLETLRLDGNPILDTSVLRELQRRGTDIDITIYRYPSWDVNQNGRVDETDVFLITATITNESPDVNGDGDIDGDDTDAADANKDGTVDTDDLLLVFEKFNRPVNLGAPLLNARLDWRLLEQIDVDGLQMQLKILRAENDGSLKYQQAIAFLQAVLTALQPNQTVLLANYPNPFNPETWIPYQLANGSNVSLTIYDARGAIVRRLELGYRAEGYYRVRGRAAHWDGRNQLGERVASGIYFYQLETDALSRLRKMVILK